VDTSLTLLIGLGKTKQNNQWCSGVFVGGLSDGNVNLAFVDSTLEFKFEWNLGHLLLLLKENKQSKLLSFIISKWWALNAGISVSAVKEYTRQRPGDI